MTKLHLKDNQFIRIKKKNHLPEEFSTFKSFSVFGERGGEVTTATSVIIDGDAGRLMGRSLGKGPVGKSDFLLKTKKKKTTKSFY